MKIVIGSDHRGVELKNFFIEHVMYHDDQEINWLDVGCTSTVYCDYPEYAVAASNYILSGKANLGVLICGAGAGMAITANRFPGIYAALVWNEEVATLARKHDNANVLVLPADFISEYEAAQMLHAWLSAEFLKGKYQQRLEMIDNL